MMSVAIHEKTMRLESGSTARAYSESLPLSANRP
jgi:hypothetical protein